jgi:hypothetical protein
MTEIEALTEDVVKYLNSPEAGELFLAQDLREGSLVQADKLSSTISKLSSIHPQKLSNEVRYMIEDSGLLSRKREDWYEVDTKFADFYMTLLAKRLSERVGAGLLTEVPASNKLAIAAKLDASLGKWGKIFRRQEEYRAFGSRRIAPKNWHKAYL